MSSCHILFLLYIYPPQNMRVITLVGVAVIVNSILPWPEMIFRLLSDNSQYCTVVTILKVNIFY
jgi:hypothetical protein